MLVVSIKLPSRVGLLSIVLICTFPMRVKNKIHLSKLFAAANASKQPCVLTFQPHSIHMHASNALGPGPVHDEDL